MTEKNKEAKKKSKVLVECEKQRDENLAGWQRERADFTNYKKAEVERNKEMRRYWDEIWIMKILELLDNLERADCHIPKEIAENEWIKARLGIEKIFLNSLKEQGLEEIKAKGGNFDPNFHEAIEQVETSDTDPGKIIEVIQKGYLLNNKLIRPSKVKVAK